MSDCLACLLNITGLSLQHVRALKPGTRTFVVQVRVLLFL